MTLATKPALIGLVLAGGESRRMGRDKGSLDFGNGTPLARHTFDLLAPHCEAVYVSIRREQASLEPYASLPLVLDEDRVQGPASGLLAAWEQFPACALFVLATDLPLVDAGLLAELAARRDVWKLATACRHPNGLLEPVCTIWEPAAAPRLRSEAEDFGSPSLRRLLEMSEAAIVEPSEPWRLQGANTPEELAEARKALEPG